MIKYIIGFFIGFIIAKIPIPQPEIICNAEEDEGTPTKRQENNDNNTEDYDFIKNN